MEVGLTYRVALRNGTNIVARYEAYDPIMKCHILKSTDGRHHNVYPREIKEFRRARKPPRAAQKRDLFLYMLRIGTGTFKVGCTSNLHERIKQGRTWCPLIQKVTSRKIPRDKTSNWRAYELEVLRTFPCSRRGGTEVYQLNANDADVMKRKIQGMSF